MSVSDPRPFRIREEIEAEEAGLALVSPSMAEAFSPCDRHRPRGDGRRLGTDLSRYWSRGSSRREGRGC
jgi:hypothetical protein